MSRENWQKQSLEQPLFPDMLWSRPENKRQAGKLLIIGGHSHSFAAVAVGYEAALASGIGQARVLLPESLRKSVSAIFPEAEYGVATPSGSFGRESLATMLELANWSDGVLLAGDFGRNSETNIALDSLLAKHDGQVTLAHDAIDYFWQADSSALKRPATTLVLNFAKLQKLAKANQPQLLLRHDMLLSELVDKLSQWTLATPAAFITKQDEQLLAAAGGQVSTTPEKQPLEWQLGLAAFAAVWQLQQPQSNFAAMSCAAFEFTKRAASTQG